VTDGKEMHVDDSLIRSIFYEFTRDPMDSSTRIMIVVALAMNGKMRMSDLMKLTGCGKSSISNHVYRLEDAGYLKTRKVSIFSSPRVIVEITDKGLEFYRKYVSIISKLSGK